MICQVVLYMSKRVAKLVGSYIGTFLSSDPNNFRGSWTSYMCIWVSFDVQKPLKRKTKLKKPRGDWFWMTFNYEHLNTFCFHYGI